jgi:hypothetical protein
MTKRDMVACILTENYKKEKPESGFVQILSFAGEQCQWTDEFLHDMQEHESSKNKKFHITNIEYITHKELPHYANSLKFKDRSKKQVPVFADKTGLFRIDFNDGDCMFFAKWYSGGGKSTILESMFATENPIWSKWLHLFQEEKKKRQKPKAGVFRITRNDYGIVYEPIKKIPNNTIYHEELPKIKASVDYYFANVASFMKYNQPGRRSLLLYGEQGTSKTSTLYQLAIQHGKEKCVVFSTDISALALHIMSCEKYSMPTLAFFEDAEGVFSQNNSSVKNFLSGIDAKQNKGGTCIVYTTNYPERMEETIIERPERIDELYYIGPIAGRMLVDCATYFFGEFLPKDVNLANVLTKPMTGAEVKLMVENTLRYCASSRIDISEEAVKAVLNKYVADLKKLKKFTDNAKQTYASKSKNDRGRVGFGREDDSPFEEVLIPSNGDGHL